MPEVVFTLAGLNTVRGMRFGGDYMGAVLHGYATAGGRQRVDIPYPQEASAESILTGVAQLDSAIGLWEGADITVLAHSQGAEVVSDWLENNADLVDAPTDLKFILIGNPCRRLGGVVTSGSGITKYGFLGRRKPTPETQYKTIDIARAGDVWANVDGWPSLDAPKIGFWQQLFCRAHTHYEDVDIENCRIREISGNTQYLLSP